MSTLSMIDLVKATLPKVFAEQGDILEIERLRLANYLEADPAVRSGVKKDGGEFLPVRVYAVTSAGRRLVSLFPRL